MSATDTAISTIPCITDVSSVIVHVVLLLNAFFFFACVRWMYKHFLALWLRVVLVVVFFVMLQSITGVSVSNLNEVSGLLVACLALYGILFTQLSFALTLALVVIVSQLSSLYFPQWANENLYIPMDTATALSFFIPVLVLGVLYMASEAAWIASIVKTFIETYLVVAAGELFIVTQDPVDSMNAPICCANFTECPFVFDIYGFAVFIVLLCLRLALVLFLIVRTIKRKRADAALLKQAKSSASLEAKLLADTDQ
jgi:hypothetical protein